MPKNNRIDLFAMGEALLEKKVAGRSTLFAQRMKGESGFPGLLSPLAKKLRNNMLCFPRALFNRIEKKRDIIYQLHSILNYIRSIKIYYIKSIKRLADENGIPSVDTLC
jgi:hypothetical protein